MSQEEAPPISTVVEGEADPTAKESLIDEAAAKEAAEKKALQEQLQKEKKERKERFDKKVANMPDLCFGGEVIYVKTKEADRLAYEALKEIQVLGVDFEWRVHFPKQGEKPKEFPISLAQVCDGHRCYIWCLTSLGQGRATGLHQLLLDPNIIKVGCGMRGSDLSKLHLSGLGVSPPIVTNPGTKKERQTFELPSHFDDVQDFGCGEQMDIKYPWYGLNGLLATFLHRKPLVTPNAVNLDWRYVDKLAIVGIYAVTDAYAVWLIWNIYHGCNKEVEDCLLRDDMKMLQAVEMVAKKNPHSPIDVPKAVTPPPPIDISGLFTPQYMEHILADLEVTEDLVEIKRLHQLHRELVINPLAKNDRHVKAQLKEEAQQRHQAYLAHQARLEQQRAKKSSPVAPKPKQPPHHQVSHHKQQHLPKSLQKQ